MNLTTDDEGGVSARPKRGRRLIYNYVSWSEAWTNYMRLMVNYHGLHMFNEMTAYQMHILDFDRRFLWKAVHSFDVEHRGNLSLKSVQFDKIDVLLANSYMNSTTVKPNAPKCSKCGSYNHLGFACHFNGSSTNPPVASRRRGYGVPIHEQICYPFQDDRCFDRWCRRRHCCKFCGGDLPAVLCNKQGPCSQPRHPPPSNNVQPQYQPQPQGPPRY